MEKQFPIEVREPIPVTADELAKAHDRQYVEGIIRCTITNGFGNTSSEVAASLVYTSGAMLCAAREAIANGKVAVAPVSGFHHAGRMRSEGFCTFNGLMVTALALHEVGVKSVGILDLDMHYGNGTDEIIDCTESRSWIKHFTAGKRFIRSHQAQKFFEILPGVLDQFARCDVVLFQAGADPHINDPYGGWLTTEQLRERDAMVFEALQKQGVPIAWNLAGGYQVEKDGSIPKILEIHDNTMRECVRVYE